ncbi:MAG TPA: YihY/virulence factor BrkB family protein [Bryobacteraceae bacterium]|nr:YihY/virulence factor BrkB family protein [Bryobacteraceae bacterium]
MARFWWLLKRSLIACHEDGCFGVAKGAAYSAILSFIPILTALAAILVQVNAQRVSQIISQFLFIAVPPGTEDLVQYSFTIRGERPIHLLVLATILSVWAASGVMATMMEGFQAVYHLPGGRPFVKQRVVAILLVFMAAAPVILGSSLLVLGDRVEKGVLQELGVIPAGEQLRGWVVLVGIAARYLTSFSAIALAVAGLYYFGPNRRQRWSGVWPGALLATFLWLFATVLFAWYVRNIANYNVMYGSVGAVMAMLVWMYVLSVVGLIGCEFNAELERYWLLQKEINNAAPVAAGAAEFRKVP